MKLALCALSVLLSAAPVWCGPSPAQSYEGGLASFSRGDYSAAERQFSACRRAVGPHPAVEYNLALTYLKLEQPGRARLYAERGLAQAPRDRNLRELLRQVLVRLGETPPPPPTGLHALWDRLRRNLTPGEALGLSAVTSLLASGLLGLRLLTGRRTALGGAAAASVFMIVGWCLAGSEVAEQVGRPRAVVVSEHSVLRAGPGEQFAEVARLDEGTELILLQRPRVHFGPGLTVRLAREAGGLWSEARTPSGAQGYVRQGLVEPI